MSAFMDTNGIDKAKTMNNDKPKPYRDFYVDALHVQVFNNRTFVGAAAAGFAAEKINLLVQEKNEVNMIFAAAPSQSDFLEEFVKNDAVPWSHINAFHMDEYLGLPAGAPQLFSNFLKARLFDRRQFRSVNLINGQTPDAKTECARYAALLQQYPADIVCMGIGENTHIAFNDPGEADFHDPQAVKVVALDQACRQQQVNDKCFDQISHVPIYALTLTIPVLTATPFICCIVPGKLKAQAIAYTLNQPVSDRYPSTILRKKKGAVLLTDTESFSLYTQFDE